MIDRSSPEEAPSPLGRAALFRGAVAPPHEAAPAVPKTEAEFAAAMIQENHREQSELESAYQRMLYLNDPDDVSKASQLAWLKMEMEDRQFTRAMQGKMRHRRSRRVSLSQLGSAGRYRRGTRMLNRRHEEAHVPEHKQETSAIPAKP